MSGKVTSTCSACGAKVWWVITKAGAKQPLDPDPNPDGNIVMRLDPVSKTQRSYVVSTQPDLLDDEPRYMPHHATCPHADEFRRKRARRP